MQYALRYAAPFLIRLLPHAFEQPFAGADISVWFTILDWLARCLGELQGDRPRHGAIVTNLTERRPTHVS